VDISDLKCPECNSSSIVMGYFACQHRVDLNCKDCTCTIVWNDILKKPDIVGITEFFDV